MPPSLPQKCLAEFVGTAGVTFGWLAAWHRFGTGEVSVFGLAAVTGLLVAALISATLALSGAHLNPAVTLGLVLGRRISLPLGLAYWLAQFAGASAGSSLLGRWVTTDGLLKITDFFPAVSGTVASRAGLGGGSLFGWECLLTFLLVFVFYGTVVDERAAKWGGLFVGLTATVAVLLHPAPQHAAVANVAYWFGPCLVADAWTDVWPNLGGPLAGGAIAGLLWGRFLGKPSRNLD